MTECETLHYDRDVAPGRAFHCASVTLRRRGSQQVAAHNHDFYEALLIVDGCARHRLNGIDGPLQPGDLLLLRPRDTHEIRLAPRMGAGTWSLNGINVAFEASSWRAFSALALSPQRAAEWDSAAQPAQATLTGAEFERAAGAFMRISLFSSVADERLELVRFLAEIVALLTRSAPPAAAWADCPPWLEKALAQMSHPDNVRAGVPALTALAGVSPAHLSRTMRSRLGVTPTEFANQQRLRRAATLLSSSSMEIVEIALECGFENLSYFYRQFARAYHKTPRAYRIDERRRVAPI